MGPGQGFSFELLDEGNLFYWVTGSCGGHSGQGMEAGNTGVEVGGKGRIPKWFLRLLKPLPLCRCAGG